MDEVGVALLCGVLVGAAFLLGWRKGVDQGARMTARLILAGVLQWAPPRQAERRERTP